MGRKHTERETLEALPLPNEQLCVARAGGSRGQNLHDVVFSDGNTGICTLPPRFRNVIWVKRGKVTGIQWNSTYTVVICRSLCSSRYEPGSTAR
jgi:hypothetical protein